jgi:hypothetical protein
LSLVYGRCSLFICCTSFQPMTRISSINWTRGMVVMCCWLDLSDFCSQIQADPNIWQSYHSKIFS